MLKNIKQQFILGLKNIEKIITLIIFMCTFSGAWFLFSYARTHGVKFIDLIQSNLLISTGALSFFIILFIVGCFLISFNLSPAIARCLYYDILAKEKIKGIKRRKLIYLLYFTSCGVASSFAFYHFYIGVLLVVIIVLTLHFLAVTKPFHYKKIAVTLKLFLYTALLLAISIAMFGFLSITLNFNIEKNFSLISIIQALSIFVIVVTLAIVGLADIHQRNRDQKNRIWCYVFFSLLIVFYISTAFSTGVSEKIANMIGLGYVNQCYYEKDLVKYSIPERLIKTQKDKSKINLFIIADVEGKIYISKDKNHRAEFMFIANELNEVSCD